MMKTNWIVFALIAFACSCFANPYMGEYTGVFKADKYTSQAATAVVIAEGPVYYRIVIKSPESKEGQGIFAEIYGVQQGDHVNLYGRSAGRNWTGHISQDGTLSAHIHYYGGDVELKKVSRQSPTLGLKPPANAIVLLPYTEGKKTNVNAFTHDSFPENRIMDDGSVQMDKTGGLTTKQSFKDLKLHVEFRIPFEPTHFGQHRGNSGVFLANSYEVQILDSFGLSSSPGDCGGIYSVTRAKVNACLPPEQWQTYDITFRAPRLKADGSVKELPRITVVHNGVTIHNNVEIPNHTIDPKKDHVAEGPLHFQDHSNPVRYRNIWAVEM